MVATLDLHANVSRDMVAETDLLVAYLTLSPAAPPHPSHLPRPQLRDLESEPSQDEGCQASRPEPSPQQARPEASRRRRSPVAPRQEPEA